MGEPPAGTGLSCLLSQSISQSIGETLLNPTRGRTTEPAGGCSSCSRNVWFGASAVLVLELESFKRLPSSSSSWRELLLRFWEEFRSMHRSPFLFLPVKLPVLEPDHVVNPCKDLFHLWVALLENFLAPIHAHIHSKVSDLFVSTVNLVRV